MDIRNDGSGVQPPDSDVRTDLHSDVARLCDVRGVAYKKRDRPCEWRGWSKWDEKDARDSDYSCATEDNLGQVARFTVPDANFLKYPSARRALKRIMSVMNEDPAPSLMSLTDINRSPPFGLGAEDREKGEVAEW